MTSSIVRRAMHVFSHRSRRRAVDARGEQAARSVRMQRRWESPARLPCVRLLQQLLLIISCYETRGADGCGLALSVYALPKTGSTFLGKFLKHFAVQSRLCKVHELRQACASHVEVGCPSSWGGHSRCHTVAVDPKPQGRRLSARSKAATKRGANAKGSAGAAAKGHSRAAGGPKRRLRRCSWAVQANHSFQLPASCCKASVDDEGDKLPARGQSLAEMSGDCVSSSEIASAKHWLERAPYTWAAYGAARLDNKADASHPKAEHTEGPRISSALQHAGFVRGPLRRLPHEGSATPALSSTDPPDLPNFTNMLNVVVLHTRHPLEAFVSQFFCVTDDKVCPKRAKMKAQPASQTVKPASGLDEFILSELASNHSSSSLLRMLASFEQLGGLIVQGQRAARAHGPSGCAARPSFTVVHSRYEHMVSNFSDWVNLLLDHLSLKGYTRGSKLILLIKTHSGRLVSVQLRGVHSTHKENGGQLRATRVRETHAFQIPKVPRAELHKSLYDQFATDFVPDGRHKHSLLVGSNVAKLQPSTLRALGSMPRIRAAVEALGYSWEPPFWKPRRGSARRQIAASTTAT